MKEYNEQVVETLDDAGCIIANKNIIIDNLQTRIAELEAENARLKAEVRKIRGATCEPNWIKHMLANEMKTQRQMFYEASRHVADLNSWFLDIVAAGLTYEELKINIERRPALWGRFSNWLDRLPKASSRQNTISKGDRDASSYTNSGDSLSG